MRSEPFLGIRRKAAGDIVKPLGNRFADSAEYFRKILQKPRKIIVVVFALHAVTPTHSRIGVFVYRLIADLYPQLTVGQPEP